MRLVIEPNYSDLSRWAGNYVAARINAANPTADKPFVLGLPTGSSPLGMYRRLVELHKQGKVSFKNVVTFNMDEYVGIPRDMSRAIIPSCTRISLTTSIFRQKTSTFSMATLKTQLQNVPDMKQKSNPMAASTFSLAA